MGKDKRALTARLPHDWRQQVWQALPESNMDLRSAVAVLQLTGCRPHELMSGVLVIYEPSDPIHGETLTLSIQGAKVGDIPDKNGILHERGQPARKIVVSLESEPASHLADLIMDQAGAPLVIYYHRKSISSRLGEISRKLFPKRKEHISAYCYRHSFSSDQKTGQVGRDTIAAALGQCSDYSQGAYSRARRSGSGDQQPKILDAMATRPIKHSRKTDQLQRFKIASKKRKAITDQSKK